MNNERRRGPYARRNAGIRRSTDWGTILGIMLVVWVAILIAQFVGAIT